MILSEFTEKFGCNQVRYFIGLALKEVCYGIRSVYKEKLD